MSRHGSLQQLSDGVATERTFDVVFRGYSRPEVDRYVTLLESQISTFTMERQDNESQLRQLTDQLHRVQLELIELRRQPAAPDEVTFRHLGLRAEQILALAEEQAEAIRASVRRDVAAERAEVEKIIDDARQRAKALVQAGEADLARQRARQDRELVVLKEAAMAEVARMQRRAEQIRQEADELLAHAQREAGRVAQAASVEADRLRVEGAAQAKSLRAKAEEEAASMSAAAEQHAQQTRLAAEQHAQQTRLAAEQHAQQARLAAEGTASEVILQAERHAKRIRSGAEEHVARLRGTTQEAAEQAKAEQARADQPQTEPGRTEQPDGQRVDAATAMHSALLRHRTTPGGAPTPPKPATAPATGDRTSDGPASP